MYPLFSYFILFIEFFSTSLYIYLVWKIVRSQHAVFRSEFFMLFLACSFYDINSVFVHGVLRHILYNPDDFCVFGAEVYSWVYKIFYAVSLSVVTAHLFVTLFIAFNRCTSVGFIQLHKKIWTHRTTMIIVIVQLLAHLPLSMYVFTSTDAVVTNATSPAGCTVVDLNPNTQEAIHIAGSVAFLFHAVVCGATNVFTFVKLSRTTYSESERKLCFHAIVMFVGSLLMVFQQVVKSYSASTHKTDMTLWMSEQFFWVNDLVIFSNMYSIILCSSQVQTVLGLGTRKPRNKISANQSFRALT